MDIASLGGCYIDIASLGGMQYPDDNPQWGYHPPSTNWSMDYSLSYGYSIPWGDAISILHPPKGCNIRMITPQGGYHPPSTNWSMDYYRRNLVFLSVPPKN